MTKPSHFGSGWLMKSPRLPPASHHESTKKDDKLWGRASETPGWHGSGSDASNGPTLSDREAKQ